MTKASKVNAAGPLSNAAGAAGLCFCNRAGGGGESHGHANFPTSKTTIRRKTHQKLLDMRSFFIQESSLGQNILKPRRRNPSRAGDFPFIASTLRRRAPCFHSLA